MIVPPATRPLPAPTRSDISSTSEIHADFYLVANEKVQYSTVQCVFFFLGFKNGEGFEDRAIHFRENKSPLYRTGYLNGFLFSLIFHSHSASLNNLALLLHTLDISAFDTKILRHTDFYSYLNFSVCLRIALHISHINFSVNYCLLKEKNGLKNIISFFCCDVIRRLGSLLYKNLLKSFHDGLLS